MFQPSPEMHIFIITIKIVVQSCAVFEASEKSLCEAYCKLLANHFLQHFLAKMGEDSLPYPNLRENSLCFAREIFVEKQPLKHTLYTHILIAAVT